jgi:uncharacterized phage protein (TIGR02220 family)
MNRDIYPLLEKFIDYIKKKEPRVEGLNDRILRYKEYINDFTEKYREGIDVVTEDRIDYIIDYLNEILVTWGKRGYKKNGKKIRSLLRTKFKQGFTAIDIEDVINIKVKWLDNPDMHKYFRPDTLFGNKFESYLNEFHKPPITNSYDKFNQAYTDSNKDFK